MSNTIVTQVQTTLTSDQLRELSGLPKDIFNELKEIGAFDIFQSDDVYIHRSLSVVCKASRLRKAFHLDANSLALLIYFIDQTEILEEKLHKFRVNNINPYL